MYLTAGAALCIYGTMASLQRYTSKGQTYWRLVESKRVNGKPRLFVLAHLGTADTLYARLTQAPDQPIKSKVFSCGGVVALMQIASELNLVPIIDRHVCKRTQGISVGTYLLLAAINRCLAPCSKNRIASWYQKTSLPRWLKIPPGALSSQRFWDHMEYVDQEAIGRIEEDVVRRLIDHFRIDPASLAFDCTNFDTCIDTATPSELAQRGHAKSKRTDLRVVGLALLVSRDFHIPLFSEVYPGNRHDAKSFAEALRTLAERIALFERNCEAITLVFDKGNNSEANQELLDRTRYHFVGSLTPTQYPDLLAIPLKNFSALKEPRFAGTKVFRTTKAVFGVTRTIMVTWSQTLYEKQVRGIEQGLAKRRRRLTQLAVQLRRSQRPQARGKGYTETSLAKRVQAILTGQHMKNLLDVKITRVRSRLRLSYRTNAGHYRYLKEIVLGKRILFTDRQEWSSEAIVEAYRGQSAVEQAFRRMKNPFFIRWSPQWHWTDSKIRVHALYCLLALTLGGLLQRQLHQKGITISIETMFRELNDICEVQNFYLAEKMGRPRSVTTLTELNDLQKQMYQALALEGLSSRT